MLFVCALLCGCEKTETPKGSFVLTTPLPETPAAVASERYDLFYYRSGYRYAENEPVGTLLGAFISGDPAATSIGEFERRTVPHAAYMKRICLTDAFPAEFVLDCISNMKMPQIIVTPPENDRYNRDALKAFAESAGILNVPMMVLLYPFSKAESFDELKYLDFFQSASIYLRHYAPSAALVFCVEGSVKDSLPCYPGDKYADWVALTELMSIKTPGGELYSDVEKSIRGLCETFADKPVMLNFAVSHFTTLNNTYYPAAAAEKLSQVYSLTEKYPRIKAINYISLNNINISTLGTVADDFSLLSDDRVIAAYREATQKKRFMNEFEPAGDIGTELFPSFGFCLKKRDDYYVPVNLLTGELGELTVFGLYSTEIDGELCVPLHEVGRIGVEYSTDEVHRTVVIKLTA